MNYTHLGIVFTNIIPFSVCDTCKYANSTSLSLINCINVWLCGLNCYVYTQHVTTITAGNF